MSDNLLEIEGLHARVDASEVLHGVSMTARRNAVTVLLGRNGVGKTSTLRTVMGLMSGSGSIRLDGREILGMRPHRIARLDVGYVPENRDVFHDLTIAENLRLAERTRDPDYALVHELFPELQERSRQRAGTLSGGQQQMVSVARALLNRNKLLLIDEPTKGLSPRLVTEVVHVLERVVSVATVVLVEQNLAAARRLADDVVVLAEGAVAATGTAAAVFADEGRLRGLLGVGGVTAGAEDGGTAR